MVSSITPLLFGSKAHFSKLFWDVWMPTTDQVATVKLKNFLFTTEFSHINNETTEYNPHCYYKKETFTHNKSSFLYLRLSLRVTFSSAFRSICSTLNLGISKM